MGPSGISKRCALSKLCKDIDERVGEFLNRPLTGESPYVWLDATYLKARQGGRIVLVAANTEGRREIIGLGIGPSEAETFWTEFLRSLRARGLGGDGLVISDAHTGLKAGIARGLRSHLATVSRSLDQERPRARLTRPAHRRRRRDLRRSGRVRARGGRN